MCTHTHTGAIYVVDELDFETKQNYDLIVRATDSVSGVSAEVPVSIVVTDINDSPPTLPLDNYEITVSESLPFGSSILQVTAQDNDIGKGKVLIILLHFFFAFIRNIFHYDYYSGEKAMYEYALITYDDVVNLRLLQMEKYFNQREEKVFLYVLMTEQQYFICA